MILAQRDSFLTPPPKVLYRWIRMHVSKVKANAGQIQLSEIEMLGRNGDVYVWPTGTTCYNTTQHVNTGTFGTGQTPDKLIDGNLATKMCAINLGSSNVFDFDMYIDLGSKVFDISQCVMWRWFTADDNPGRDPVSFSLQLSVDAESWFTVDSVSDFSPTTDRKSLAYTGAIQGAAVPTASAYVQNGLVAMWDGIENAGGGVHDASATSWLDLVANKQMPTTLSSLSWDSNALVRSGVDGLTYDTGLDFSDPLSERTFEFVISYDADYTDTSSNYFVARFNDLSTWLSFWNRTKFGISLYAGGGTNETPFGQPSFKGSVSLVGSSTPYVINPTQRHYAYYYANGTYFKDGAFGGGSSSSAVMELFAAARNWPSSNTIKIHSIRIYSRALTAAEIAANYTVDAQRFGIGGNS